MFKNKNVLIIGGTGTIGQSLIEYILQENARVIRVFSRDEYKQFEMQNQYKYNKKMRFLLGDVRDKERLIKAMNDIDIVFHAAALKQVPFCEYNPYEAVKTNVIGTQNVIEAANMEQVERVIFMSTDKMINPVNTYGATKLLAERLITAAGVYRGGRKTIFSAVRFGNIMGSRGSVIPLFKKQIIEEGLVTITNYEMNRFMMTLKQATELTISACKRALGGEVFVLKMPIVRIGDLAQVIIEETCNKYMLKKDSILMKEIGLRPGEKMFEELMTMEESKNALEFKNMFVIQSSFAEEFHTYENAKRARVKTYNSDKEPAISREQLRDIIIKENLI